jgi:tRNA (mo5U34)-methyltransferase
MEHRLARKILDLVRSLIQARGSRGKPSLPLRGFTEHKSEIRYVDALSDEELTELNRLLPWHSFTVDAHGRRFGDAAWAAKRDVPQVIPDPRVVQLDEWFGLADKHVLEVGCFEGIHTVALAERAKVMTAVDARIENVVKTIVRASLYGFKPTVFRLDLEGDVEMRRLEADVLFHVGVLYHLRDPIRHLLDLGRFVRVGVLLDTHIAEESEAVNAMVVDGREYFYRRFAEGGVRDVFSGMYDHAKWLTEPTIVELLQTSGFAHVRLLERRAERNGPRILLVASKSPLQARPPAASVRSDRRSS